MWGCPLPCLSLRFLEATRSLTGLHLQMQNDCGFFHENTSNILIDHKWVCLRMGDIPKFIGNISPNLLEHENNPPFCTGENDDNHVITHWYHGVPYVCSNPKIYPLTL